MNNHIVPSSQLIPIIEHDGKTAVNLRDLHKFLEVSRDFSNWAKQMFEYGFTDGQDYVEVSLAKNGEQTRGGHNRRDWAVTLDMAKEVSMIQRTDKGKQARQYFIEAEKQRNEALAALPRDLPSALRALADSAEREAINAPKVEYHDRFVADGDEMKLRTVASVLGVGEYRLRDLLIANEWIYREESERWSESQKQKVKQYRYSEYSHKKDYFHRVMEHKAPRFRGEVMYTLKITPAGANAIDRLIQRVIKDYGDLDTAIQQLEAQRQARINNRKDAA